MLGFRRQRHQEIATVLGDLDATERHITEPYTKAVEQLGSDEAPVRFRGLYALERFAQDNPAHRQTIVDVICAYLRMPFSPTAPASKPEPEAAEGQKEPGTESEAGTDGIGGTWQQERQVRLSAQRILAEHLRDDRAKDQRSTDPPSSRFWNNICLDLTSATLIDFNLLNGVMADANFGRAAFSGNASFFGAAFSGDASFSGAAFSGDASFSGAAFSGDASFFGAAFSGDALFGGAAFSGDARFGGAVFSGDARFGGAVFSGDARFGGAAFSGDAWFDKAAFRRGASFGEATFTGNAWFDKAALGGDASFDGAAFTGDAWFGEAAFTGVAGFGEATFGGDAWFDMATFRRGASFGEAAFTGVVWFGEATSSCGADALHFEKVRVLSPNASHVWPTGWRLADGDGDGDGYTVVRANDDGGSLSLRVPDSRHGLDVGNASTLPEESGSQRANSTRPGVAPPAALNVSRSRLGSVVAIVGAGLLMVGVGDALGRAGHQSPVVPLFLAGLTFIFAPCAWRLTGTAATRNERVWVSVILGLGLLASYVFRSPLIFDNFDEMAHGATLTRLLDSRALFQTNPILPVSPFYPGIELTTIATRWLTGLPLLLDQMVVLVLARIVLVLCVFLIVERACHSSRAGGIGVLVYAANPEFYSLGAQYGYQTLALAFAVAVVYLLFVSIDAAQPKRGRLFALALISIAGMVVSHHVTAWLTIGFLVVWAAGLRFIIDPAGRPATAATAGQILTTEDLAQFARRKEQSRIIGLAALVGVVLVVAWIAFLGDVLTGYIDPIVQAGVRSAIATLDKFHGNRKLFQNSAGGGTPHWESALILAAAVFFCLIILISLCAVIWKKSVRGGRLRYLPAVIAATYPLAILSNISSDAKDIGSRTTTFIFFAVAVVVGGWLAGRLLRHRGVIERMATIGVAVICFLGSTLYGGGPLPLLVNGPYIVGAHERSLGSPSLALANWVSTHLPAGSHVAVDRDNAGLLNNFGQVYPVTPLNGADNPASLFFDPQLTPSDIALIRKDDIRYIVTDTRLTEGLPLFGAYIAPGETGRPTRLTAAELEKFNSIPGVYRIYDNGAIQVYDLSRLLGERPLVVPRDSVRSIRATGTDVAVLILAILVAAVWLLRLRRRARLAPIDAHMVVCGMVGALAIGLFGTFAILLIHLPPGRVAILCLLALLVLGLRRPAPLEATTEPHMASAATNVAGTEVTSSGPVLESAGQPPGRTHRARSPQFVLGCVGLALFAVGASFAVVAAQKEWVPPPELSIAVGRGRRGRSLAWISARQLRSRHTSR